MYCLTWSQILIFLWYFLFTQTMGVTQQLHPKQLSQLCTPTKSLSDSRDQWSRSTLTICPTTSRVWPMTRKNPWNHSPHPWFPRGCHLPGSLLWSPFSWREVIPEIVLNLEFISLKPSQPYFAEYKIHWCIIHNLTLGLNIFEQAVDF